MAYSSYSNDYINLGIWSLDDTPYAESTDVGNDSGWGLNDNWRNLVSEVGKVHTGLEITERAAEPSHLSGKAGLWLKEVGAEKHLYGRDVDAIVLDGNFRIAQDGGNYNTFVGVDSGVNIVGGVNNAFIGNSAGYHNNNGSSNVFIGYQTGYYNGIGNNNTFIGNSAGHNNASGHNNTFIGYQSGWNSKGQDNVFVGYRTGYNNSIGENNTFIGNRAGRDNTSGHNNTFIGYQSGWNNQVGSDNTFIGYYSGYNETGSNKLYIANSNTATPLIYGEFDNSKLIFNCAEDLAQLAVQPTGGIDLAIATTKYVDDKTIGTHYYEDPDTDGSWKREQEGNDLVDYRRESGSWVEKSRVTS